jgi:hypothetical protein
MKQPLKQRSKQNKVKPIVGYKPNMKAADPSAAFIVPDNKPFKLLQPRSSPESNCLWHGKNKGKIYTDERPGGKQ